MVNIDDIYMVMATVAIAHEVPEPKSVDVKDFEQLLDPPITITNSPVGMLVSSQRDQIEILFANTKVDFRDLSGRKDFSSKKISEVVKHFTSKFGLKTNSYGINFMLRVPHSEPQKWIVENVLSSGISEKTGKVLLGGAGTVSLKSGRKTWKVGFQASDDNNIEVNLNASEKRGELPSEVALGNELKKQWGLLVTFLSNLGLLQE